LTDYSLKWLDNRNHAGKKPFFMYVSHKAVHADFVAADRHLGRYKNKELPYPPTFANTSENYLNKPRWLKDQRNSRHGVDFAYNLPDFDLENYYIRYCETLLAVDEGLGLIMDKLKQRGELEETLIVFLGDNGFQFGEQGLIDKRTAYEASMRIPLLLHCPADIKANTTVQKVVANIDIGPTILEAAGLTTPDHMDGKSFYQLAKGNDIPWRDYVLYEYFWERNYPHTPTIHALRGERYKYIRYHGLWDVNELYDLQEDPHETTNLFLEPCQQERISELNQHLFSLLQQSKGLNLPMAPDRGPTFPNRHPDRSTQGEFPKAWIKPHQ
jgi:N-acetylglucosamine-6-sulfatase